MEERRHRSVSQKPAWYVESGQGMGATLTIASEKGAYTLTDRATYLANKDNLQLDLLVEKDNSLLNVYHVITVNPEKWPKINYDGAIAFAKWITEPCDPGGDRSLRRRQVRTAALHP